MMHETEVVWWLLGDGCWAMVISCWLLVVGVTTHHGSMSSVWCVLVVVSWCCVFGVVASWCGMKGHSFAVVIVRRRRYVQ